MLDRGWRVIVLDNLVTGRRENLAELEGRPDFELRLQDVTEPFTVDEPVTDVLHLASPASPVDFATIPLEIVRVGTRGTDNMMALALDHGARALFASTSEVYGDPLVHPQVEGYWGNVNPIGIRGCYDESKRAGEAYTMAYHRQHGLDTRIVRIFNTYGPLMRPDDGRVIPNYMAQALAGRPLTVYGDGGQTRSLCYVDDLVEGILAVLERGDHRPFNLGNPHEVTMLELAHLVAAAAGAPDRIEFRPLPEDDPKQRRPDIGRAREMLGWEPAVPLAEGLARTLEHFRQAGPGR